MSELKKACFAAAQAVAVDEIEEQEITGSSLGNAAEEPLDFCPRQVLDRFLIAALALRHSVLSLRTAGDSNAFPQRRSLGKAGRTF
jgi:hypothetical protein